MNREHTVRKCDLFSLTLLPLTIAAILFLHATRAEAATYTWAVASGDWSTPSCWGGIEPTANDYALIKNDQTAFITLAGEACYRLTLGNQGTANSGTVQMTGGTLSANRIIAGSLGIGTFTQSAGTVTLSDNLYLGFGDGVTTGVSGTYTLRGTGQLSAVNQFIGEDLPFYNLSAAGLFQQESGSNSANFISIGRNGEYKLSGGTLQINGGLDNGGILDFNGGAVTINAAANSIINLARSGSELKNSQAVSLTVLGANSLVIVPADFVPANFASFSNQGVTHYAGTTLSIAPGQTISGSGSIDDHVDCQGTLTARRTINLNKGLSIGSAGSVNLGTGGVLKIEDATSSMSGGTLAATQQYVGFVGTGIFQHSAGTSTVNSLYVGYYYDANGTYELSGTGKVTSSSTYIGCGTTGAFNQMGGTHTINSTLCLGWQPLGAGTYNLSGGTLSAATEYIGYGDSGAFIHSAGTHTTSGTLTLGNLADSHGTYEMNGTGATLTVANEAVGELGTGTFTQSAGNHTVNSWLYVGHGATGIGNFNLSGGQLTVKSGEYVGHSGAGTFTQSGGTHTITGTLYLGNSSTSQGTYNLNGGTLELNSILNAAGAGVLNFGGGTLRAKANLSVIAPVTLTGIGGDAKVDTGTYSVTFTRAISGIGALTMLGSSTLSLSTANTFSGDTKISGGNITLENAAALQNSTLDYNSYGGILKFGSIDNATLGGIKGNQAMALSGVYSAVALSVGNNGQSTVYSGALSGAGSLKKIGAGMLTLSGSNSYTGSTTITAGTLQIPKSGSLPGYSTAGNIVVNNGGTLAVNAGGTGEWTATSIQTLLTKATFASGSAFALDTTNAAGGNFDYTNPVSGNFGLTKLGPGTLTLTGALTYAGTTTIDQGILKILTPTATQATVVLHEIVGAGTLVVGDGSHDTHLSATSIRVGTLTIGTGQGAMQTVPEPSSILLLLAAVATLIGIVKNRIPRR